jgi:hypothetical protein
VRARNIHDQWVALLSPHGLTEMLANLLRTGAARNSSVKNLVDEHFEASIKGATGREDDTPKLICDLLHQTCDPVLQAWCQEFLKTPVSLDIGKTGSDRYKRTASSEEQKSRKLTEFTAISNTRLNQIQDDDLRKATEERKNFYSRV